VTIEITPQKHKNRCLIAVVCSVMIVILAAGVIRYQTQQARVAYRTAARQVLTTIYTTMVAAENMNVMRNGIVLQANKLQKTHYDAGSLFEIRWTRVVRNNPQKDDKNSDEDYLRFIYVSGIGFVDADRAVQNMLRDATYQQHVQALRDQSGAIYKEMRALSPTDGDAQTYQKLIRLQALSQQYVETTLSPPKNTLLGANTQYDIALEYMLLHRELDNELP
jgi:hypothetical protein